MKEPVLPEFKIIKTDHSPIVNGEGGFFDIEEDFTYAGALEMVKVLTEKFKQEIKLGTEDQIHTLFTYNEGFCPEAFVVMGEITNNRKVIVRQQHRGWLESSLIIDHDTYRWKSRFKLFIVKSTSA